MPLLARPAVCDFGVKFWFWEGEVPTEPCLNCVPLALPVCISPSPRYAGERAGVRGATEVKQSGACSTKGGSPELFRVAQIACQSGCA